LKRLFHRDLEERDWKKIAGDIVQLAQAPLEPPTEEEARLAYEEYTVYEGSSTLSMFHALRRFVERRSSAVPPQFKAGDRVRLVRTDGLGRLEFKFANKVGCIVSAGDISNDRRQLLTVRFDGKIQSFFAWRFDVVPESKFKPGDRVCLDKGEWNVLSGTVGTVMSTSLDDLEDVDFRPAAPRIFVPRNRLHLVEPAFKVGDRVRIENFPGSIQGELGCIHKVVSASEYLVRCDNGSFPSVHASWVKPAPQFKDGQRVRVRATGQVARIGAVLADGRFMVEGSAYGAVGLEPAPFKVGDRVRWKLSSSLPFCHGQVEYLSDERAGVQTDGQFVEVAERLLEAEPDPAFRVGDRVEVLATGSKGRVIKGQGASGLIAVMMESSVILYLDSKKIKFLEADLISWKEWRRV
jgi:hypothetical protein